MGRLDFLGGILLKFENLLRQLAQRYHKKVTTAVLYKNENLVSSMFY